MIFDGDSQENLVKLIYFMQYNAFWWESLILSKWHYFMTPALSHNSCIQDMGIK